MLRTPPGFVVKTMPIEPPNRARAAVTRRASLQVARAAALLVTVVVVPRATTTWIVGSATVKRAVRVRARSAANAQAESARYVNQALKHLAQDNIIHVLDATALRGKLYSWSDISVTYRPRFAVPLSFRAVPPAAPPHRNAFLPVHAQAPAALRPHPAHRLRTTQVQTATFRSRTGRLAPALAIVRLCLCRHAAPRARPWDSATRLRRTTARTV